MENLPADPKARKALIERRRDSLRDALVMANDIREAGSYAISFSAPRPPAIQFCEGVDLEAIAFVSPLQMTVHLLPDVHLDHDELVWALTECQWAIERAEEILR